MMNALIHFNSVGISFVILLILLSQFQIRPASGLQCYECTSEDPGCDKKVASTPALKKECGADVIGCGIYAVYYDFFIGAIFHRSCIYSYDLYNETTDIGLFGLDHDGYETRLKHEWYRYENIMSAWNIERKRNEDEEDPFSPSVVAPPVVAAKHFPILISGRLQLRVFLQDKFGGLSNGDEFSKWTWPGFTREETPSTKTIECYSCEFEIKGKLIDSIYRADNAYREEDQFRFWNMPPCGSKDRVKLKKVTCKNAYGCATLLEMKNASNVMFRYGHPREDRNQSVSRVWRGCWYPGEQKCLRNPDSMIKPAQRNLKSLKAKMSTGEARQTDTQTADCDKAYKRAFDLGNGVVVWGGIKPIFSSDEYNKYLECRHKARLGVNAESQLTLVTEKIDTEYTWIQFLFCGPKSKCNRYIEVDKDEIGKAKYNPKDYEEFEEKVVDKKVKNVTKLDECNTEDESGEDEKNASVVLMGFSRILNALLLTSIFLLY